MELEKLFSLPAHPLLVHIPVVCVPLAAVGAILLAIRPSWIRPYGLIVAAVAAVGAFGAVLAAGSGESLEDAVRTGANRSLVRDHADLGEAARNIAFLMFVLIVAMVAIDWYQRRNAAAAATTASKTDDAGERAAAPARTLTRWLPVTVSVLTALASIGGIVSMVQAGHSGAKAVWHDTQLGEARGR